MQLTKICKVCKKELPATTEFFKKKITGAMGLTTKCNLCMKEYVAKNYQKHREKDSSKKLNIEEITLKKLKILLKEAIKNIGLQET